MNPRNLAIIGVIAATLITLLFIVGRGEEDVLKNRLQDLISKVEKAEEESIIQSAANARSVSNFFVQNPALVISGYNVSANSREDIQRAVLAARNSFNRISIRLTSFEASIDEQQTSATTLVDVRVNFTGRDGSDSGSGGYRIEWEKIDGEWLIARFEPTR